MISAEHSVLQKGKLRKEVAEGRYSPLDIESENFDTVVILPLHSFFAGVELFAFVDVFATGVASPTGYA